MNLSDAILEKAGRAYMRAVLDGDLNPVALMRRQLPIEAQHHVDAVSIEKETYVLDNPRDRAAMQEHITKLLTRLHHAEERLREA